MDLVQQITEELTIRPTNDQVVAKIHEMLSQVEDEITAATQKREELLTTLSNYPSETVQG